jgi:hypothetical protein
LFGRTTELQGHAIKNQDLLIASGTVSLKGSEGLSAVDDDIEAAVSAFFLLIPMIHRLLTSSPFRLPLFISHFAGVLLYFLLNTIYLVINLSSSSSSS